jgi:hypothetical protein
MRSKLLIAPLAGLPLLAYDPWNILELPWLFKSRHGMPWIHQICDGIQT